MNVELTEKSLGLEKENPAARRNLVIFRLGRQTYGLPIESIVEIIPLISITPVPQVNHTVKGIINVRGKVIPVIDLRPHLGLRKAAWRLHTPILLVRNGKGMVGLIIDQVIDVLSLPAEEVVDFADFLPRGRGLQKVPVLQGVAHTQDGTALLLDLDHLFPISTPLS